VQFQEFAVTERDYEGVTPLHFACGRGHLGVVAWLLDNGASPMVKDHAGSTPLHEAAQNGHLAVSIEPCFQSVVTVSILVQCVRLLMQKGCLTTVPDNDGLTAQQLADLFWQAECAAQLKSKSDGDCMKSTTLNAVFSFLLLNREIVSNAVGSNERRLAVIVCKQRLLQSAQNEGSKP
jgi:hypothetical protein